MRAAIAETHDRPIVVAVRELGSQQALADAVGVTQAAVSQWVNDDTAIDMDHFPRIEKATSGKVTTTMLLEDQLARAGRSKAKKRA